MFLCHNYNLLGIFIMYYTFHNNIIFIPAMWYLLCLQYWSTLATMYGNDDTTAGASHVADYHSDNVSIADIQTLGTRDVDFLNLSFLKMYRHFVFRINSLVPEKCYCYFECYLAYFNWQLCCDKMIKCSFNMLLWLRLQK